MHMSISYYFYIPHSSSKIRPEPRINMLYCEGSRQYGMLIPHLIGCPGAMCNLLTFSSQLAYENIYFLSFNTDCLKLLWLNTAVAAVVWSDYVAMVLQASFSFVLCRLSDDIQGLITPEWWGVDICFGNLTSKLHCGTIGAQHSRECKRLNRILLRS
jgi:hypothetical protein